MAGSTLSSDALSSPSPTPSPPPAQQIFLSQDTTHTGAPNTSTAAPFRAIDTDSELSELTDEDQDASTAAEKRAASTATASSSKGPGGTAIDDDDDPPPTGSRPPAARSPKMQPQRGLQRYPNSSRRPGPGRKKRSSLVPAPMWGWAMPEKVSSNAAVVEEEEEDPAGSPRPMEEEEEEDEEMEEEEEEGDEYDAYDHGGDSGDGEEDAHNHHGLASQRRQGPYPSKRMPYGQPYPAKTRGTARQPSGPARRNPRKQDDDYEDDDAEDDTLRVERRSRQVPGKRIPPKHDSGDARPTANGEDDDEGSASGGSEYLSSKRKKSSRSRAATSSSRKRKGSGNDESSGSDVPASSRKKNSVKVQNGEHHEGDDETVSNGGDNTDSDAEAPKIPAQPVSPSKVANSKPLTAISPTAANSGASALSTLAALANAVDPTHPPPTSAINSAGVPVAIINGATSGEIPPSGATSGTNTRPASRSRSHSSANDSDGEANSEDESKRPKSKGKGGKPLQRNNRSKTRGKPTPVDKKNPHATANGDVSKATNPAKKGPPAPLDLKIDTSVPAIIATGDQDMEVDEEANEHPDEQDVDMDPSEPADEDEAEEEDDGEDEVDDASAHDEDEEPEHVEEEAVEVEQDADEEVNEADDDAADQDGDDDQDQEQENDQDAAEVEPENEEGEEGDDDNEEPSADVDIDIDVEDHESDLQPAHRAEALDVLASIEFKFALLRERVYVEKMEVLAWEESLVQNSAHPELQHLQKELSKRRDKRLELASRKRSYEISNAVTRRNADESNIWSWWQFSRDDLQTEMIAETSRKRRKLERERRAIERPQPIRRIPHPMDAMPPPLGPPSLRKIIKAYPFGSRKHNKPDTHHHHHAHSHYPKNLVYPEISTLSTTDIQNDMEFLLQYRRNAYDQPLQQQPHYPAQLQRNVSGMNGMGMGRSMSMGMGMSNGALPPMQAPPPAMGPPPPGSGAHQHMQQHAMGYEPYSDIAHAFGPPGAPGRVREQYSSQGPGGPLPPGGPPPPGGARDNLNSYSNFQPPPPHGPPMLMGSRQHHGYPGDHEMSSMASGGPSNNSIGHQIHPNHPYFGQGSMGPGNNSNTHGSMPPSAHMSSHPPSSMKGDMVLNGRRSVSPVHGIPNGSAGSKSNGNWLGGRMDAAGFHGGSSSGKGGDWDARMIHEEEERDRMMRERERERKRDERDKEKEHRDREMDRDRMRRERDYDLERERHGHQHMQQMSQQHRQPAPSGASSSHSGLSHMHSSGNANGPPPSQGPVNNHHVHNHHHHRTHHHHVVHRHHTQHAPSSMPHSGGGAPPIVHSPRYENSRPLPQGPMHAGPGQPHPTELITLSSNKRETGGSWPNKNVDDFEMHGDYRDREREARNRERSEREQRRMLSGRHSTGPAIPPFDDRGDRPMATPFVMASSHTMQQSAAGMSSSHLNGSGMSSSTSSPRGPPSWNGAGALEDPSYRMSSSAPPPSGYLGSPHDAPMRSPVQGHRYASTSGSHIPPPLGRMSSSSSSGIHHRMSSPLPPPSRARPPASPPYPSAAHRSPATSPKLRALSPVPVSGSGKHILSGPLPGPGYSSTPHLSGPGRASTPTGHQAHSSSSLGPPPSMQDVVMKNGSVPSYVGSRTASPLMSSLAGSGRPSMNGGSGTSGDRDRMDRDRERPSPRLGASSVPLAPPPSKLSTAQMVDGH